MIKVVILGLGNLGIPLAKTLLSSNDLDLIQVYSHSYAEPYFDGSVPVTNKIINLLPADVYILTVKDDVISSFSKKLQGLKGLVVHTSGTVPLKSLEVMKNRGVLYPVQSFNADREVDFKKVPIVYEVEDERDNELLEKLATSISETVFRLSSEQRMLLHISCVFANNFTNHMYTIASDICEENGFSFDLIKPLILETAEKVFSNLPEDVQTGPAIRNDFYTIQKHMDILNNNRKEIYNLVTKSIQNTNKN